ncbi:PAS domain-containing protein [Nonomuraea sp. NBC_01738]|uniref:PAS domain-containing protein n=1 Tax=Nonomuraea sp. NBC_01738 TaxID=2976003 RepID=UPI002E10F554|nr:PAS domain-containing protein [Nonomuraea sp. NBC_01738]
MTTSLDALAERISSLREARTAYPDDLGPTLDAALTELETALQLLSEAEAELRKIPRRGNGKKDGAQRELKLLRQVFRAFPVPVAVLDGGGVVRRINGETSRLLGSPDGYLVGRSFPLLVDVSRRAAFRSHLTAVLRTGRQAAFETRLSHQGRTHTVRLALTLLTLAGEPQPMVAAVALPVDVRPPPPTPRARNVPTARCCWPRPGGRSCWPSWPACSWTRRACAGRWRWPGPRGCWPPGGRTGWWPTSCATAWPGGLRCWRRRTCRWATWCGRWRRSIRWPGRWWSGCLSRVPAWCTRCSTTRGCWAARRTGRC